MRGRNHDQGWMAKLSSSVKKRKLSKITIPSTHDSAMYSTRKDLPLAQNAASFMFGFAIWRSMNVCTPRFGMTLVLMVRSTLFFVRGSIQS